MNGATISMKRRQFVGRAASAAFLGGIARPSVVRAASATTLKFVPYADLALLDPLVSAFVTRNHVMMVFDTLFSLDAAGVPQHQMLAGHTVGGRQHPALGVQGCVRTGFAEGHRRSVGTGRQVDRVPPQPHSVT
jgi:hypothetical protein